MIRRTMCCLCVSFVLGILYGRSRQWELFAVFLFLLAAMAASVIRRWEHAWCAAGARVVFCVILFAVGSFHMQSQQDVRDCLEAALSAGDTVTVEGKVLRKEQSFTKDVQLIYYLTDTQVILGGKAYPAFGILIYSQDNRYQPGNLLKVTGRYMPFQISRNEGNFNEKQYQQSRKWEFRVYADAEIQISANIDRYAIALGALRARMRGVFAALMDAQSAGVMADMALGEKSLLSAEIKDLYRSAGISHILAISGLHVSLLGMGVFSCLQRFGCPRKWGALMAAFVIYSFGVFSGMEVSAMRAIGMFALMMAAQVLGYAYDSLTALSLCAMVQLWGNPFLLDYAGFLLSYGAVLGVTVIWTVVREAKKESEKEADGQKKQKFSILHNLVSKWMDTLAASICIQFAVLPLSAYFYYEIPTYSIFANVCILPFMGWLLSLGILGGLLGTLHPFLGTIFLEPAGWLLALTEHVCRFAFKLPGAEFVAGKPPLELVIIYYAVLAVCLYLIWRSRKRRYLMGVFLALMCLLFVRGSVRFEIDVLDVGQGDGIFIQNDNGEHFFVDGGSSDVKDVGEYRILPFLKSKGVRSLKGWIVSHGDADHISGLLEVLRQGYPVEYLILAEYMVRDEVWETLMQEAGQAGCKVLSVSPGMEFGSGELSFTALAPGKEGAEDETHADDRNLTGKKANSADRNAASLSLMLKYRTFCGILTGDIGSEQEKALVENGCLKKYGIRNVDFYKAAHHGSDHSNSQEILEALSPKMTVISCAEKNSYGHPGEAAVGRIRETGSQVFFTMEQGQVRIRPEGADVRVWTYLPGTATINGR